MSETLGEKIRKARENRGISISQVSEQTRIASHHLNAIEENDFSGLPGGIFNKGFVRSFAKCVGVDEQEALNDYNSLMATMTPEKAHDELYTPEVLTDDRTGPSMVSTVILIVIILGVLIGGLIGAYYWLSTDDEVPSANSKQPTVAANNAQTPATASTPTPVAENFTVEISSKDKIIEFSYEVDGEKIPIKVLKPGETLSLTPKEAFRGSFYRSIVPAVTLVINGQEIALNKPTKPYLDIAVNKDNVAEIVSAKIYGDAAETPTPTDGVNRPVPARTPKRNANGSPSSGTTPAPSR